jgi:hypothetical protein
MRNWSEVQSLVGEFGLLKATFLLFFVLAHTWIFHLYTARLADRQLEMNRLAAENLDYRERFVLMLDRQMGHAPPPRRAQSHKLKKGDR